MVAWRFAILKPPDASDAGAAGLKPVPALAVQQDEGLRQRFAVPWQKVLPTEKLEPRDMVFVEPLSVGFHAIDRVNV
jgi:hypothetical protein